MMPVHLRNAAPDMETINRNVQLQLNDIGQQRQHQSHKRKRDSPGFDSRSPHRAPAQDETQQDGDAASAQLQQAFFAAQQNHDMRNIGQEVERHVANSNPSSSSTTAAAALAASMPQLTVPQPTELSFPTANSGNEEDRHPESSFDMGPDNMQQHTEGAPYNLGAYAGANGDHMQNSNGPGKPAVGTDEWHKVRKDNHKEVERRRRETINEGINELAKIVPGCDKNKGAILQRGVQYITQLKENESTNIEKWTLEKMLTDQAIAELTSSVDKLRDELNKTRREAERWKGRCESAGVDVDAEEEEEAAEQARGR